MDCWREGRLLTLGHLAVTPVDSGRLTYSNPWNPLSPLATAMFPVFPCFRFTGANEHTGAKEHTWIADELVLVFLPWGK